jgi:hypothetical protein
LPLPKALKAWLYAVFGPLVGQKLHFTLILVPSAE